MCKRTSAPRLTVAGLVVCPGGEYPLIPMHWPEAAALAGEDNLTTVGGGVLSEDNNSPLEAMKRELYEEYSVTNSKVLPINHPRWVSKGNGKLYAWCLVVCNTRPHIVPQAGEVAALGWYSCPKMLHLGVRQMSTFKQQMFLSAFVIACETYPEHFGGYVSHVGRFRRLQRKRKETQDAST